MNIDDKNSLFPYIMLFDDMTCIISNFFAKCRWRGFFIGCLLIKLFELKRFNTYMIKLQLEVDR